MDVERKEWHLYPQAAYDSQPGSAKKTKDEPVPLRRKRKYENEGMRRTVRALLLVHVHGHPHVLALQSTGDGSEGRDGAEAEKTSGGSSYSLPGGMLRPGESERDGLNRKMKQFIFNADPTTRCEWKIGDLLAIWWCPSFEGVAYPYLPQHVTRPKECIKIYQVSLPERCVFAVPPKERLVAVPFFDIFEEPQAYGPMLGNVPQLASKYAMSLHDLPQKA
mmetsp:Transcript_161778/g.286799  ORF Transcript_161778/g.286799 Transcript_161778/m.286799 type:complete len:220 (+) Transcript_161778:49-708(+)